MASYKVEFSKRVRKDFKKLPKQDAERILAEIQRLSEEPLPTNAKKLKGEELFRIRIGVYRVIYSILEERLVVLVVKVGHRKDIYKN